MRNKMVKKLFNDIFVYLFSGTITYLVTLLLIPIYTKSLSPADYGKIELLFILSNLACIIISLEIYQAIGRYTIDISDPIERKRYVSTGLVFSLAAYLFLLIIGIVNAPLISKIVLNSGSDSLLISFFIISIMGNGIFILLRSQLRWLSMSVRFSIANFLFSFFTLLFTIIFLIILNTGLIGVFLGQIGGSIIGIIVSFYYLRGTFSFFFEISRLKELLRFSSPLVPSSLGLYFSQNSDRIIIPYFLGFYYLGIYTAGYKISAMVSFLIVGLDMAITPHIIKTYKDPDGAARIEKIFRVVMVLVLSFILLLQLYTQEILLLMTDFQYIDAKIYIHILSFAFLFSGIYIFAPGLWIAKKTRLIAIINISNAAINIVLNYILVQFFGLIGIAFSILITAITFCYINQKISQTHYPINYSWNKIFFVICIILFNLVVINSLNNFSNYLVIVKPFLLLISALVFVKILLTKNEIALISTYIIEKLSTK
jgi:O-antigen/teichoic acid export membrane protein